MWPGVDLNPEIIAVARSVQPDIPWHLGNAIELPFENGSFDVVLCQQGFQFFSDRAAAALETRRVLADGGRIAFTWRPLEENPLFHGRDSAAARRFESDLHVPRRAGIHTRYLSGRRKNTLRP